VIWLRFLGAMSAWLGACCIALAANGAPERGATWASLSTVQQQALAPLQAEWATLEPSRRSKWLELAARFPTMPPEERRRVQERMAAWVRLTPAERTNARMQFQEVRQLPAEERQAKWQAYQALSEDERKELAARSKASVKPAATPTSAGKESKVAGGQESQSVGRGTPGATTRAVAPIVVQAHPGATTSTMSTQTPPHQTRPPGVPKIAATAGYVDPATLLPKHGGTPGGPNAEPQAPSR
jgi:hypothetical protein